MSKALIRDKYETNQLCELLFVSKIHVRHLGNEIANQGVNQDVDELHYELWVFSILVDVPGSEVMPYVTSRIPTWSLS